LPGYPGLGVPGLDIETAQAVNQLPRDLADRYLASTPIAVDETIKQGRRRSGKRHFKVQGQDIVVDSGHRHSATMRTKKEHLVNRGRREADMTAQRRSQSAARR